MKTIFGSKPDTFDLRIGWGTILVQTWRRVEQANDAVTFSPRESPESMVQQLRRTCWENVANALIAAFEAEGWTVPKRAER